MIRRNVCIFPCKFHLLKRWTHILKKLKFFLYYRFFVLELCYTVHMNMTHISGTTLDTAIKFPIRSSPVLQAMYMKFHENQTIFWIFAPNGLSILLLNFCLAPGNITTMKKYISSIYIIVAAEESMNVLVSQVIGICPSALVSQAVGFCLPEWRHEPRMSDHYWHQCWHRLWKIILS